MVPRISGKPGIPGNNLEFEMYPGKPGKPGNNLEFCSLSSKNYFYWYFLYFSPNFLCAPKLSKEILRYLPLMSMRSWERMSRKFDFREKITWDFRKIWPGKPGNNLEFHFLKVLGTMIMRDQVHVVSVPCCKLTQPPWWWHIITFSHNLKWN